MKRMIIDFLYLDLETCERCMETNDVLLAAIAEIKEVIQDYDIQINKINVWNEELAIKYRFKSSPTIRINGRDIELKVKENNCQCCSDLCGSDVTCREWTYEGKKYDTPPKGMLLEKILMSLLRKKTIHRHKRYVMPNNLRKFYNGLKKNKRRDENDN